MAVLYEFTVKLGIVEDLAVEDGNHAVVLAAVGLVSSRHVYDGQPPGHQAHALVSLDGEVIGPSVLEHCAHPMEDGQIGRRAVDEVEDAGDAAHEGRSGIEGNGHAPAARGAPIS
jgi:hypothetical protein